MGKNEETNYEIHAVEGIEERKVKLMKDLVKYLPPGLSKSEVVLKTDHPWLSVEERMRLLGLKELDPSVKEQLQKKSYSSTTADTGR